LPKAILYNLITDYQPTNDSKEDPMRRVQPGKARQARDKSARKKYKKLQKEAKQQNQNNSRTKNR
jgi:hypothetical protein